FAKIIHVFFNMDKMVGGDFEAGLAKLKAAAEKELCHPGNSSDERTMTTASATSPMTREVTLTRIIDAPRALVWAAWTEPEHMAPWWGPHRFTTPVCEMDVRPGGKMLIHMKAPDGTVYPMP